MTHYSFNATDSIGRPGTLFVDPEHPIYGQSGSFSLDTDPGFGSMTSTQPLTMLRITSGTPEGLRLLAQWGESRWSTPAGWLDQIRALASAIASAEETHQ